MSINKYGLSRYIPTEVRRQVRQRCGFGCVVCSAALYDYDHFDPEFSEAKEHRVDGIALLCPSHHRAKVSGTLTQDAYLEAIANPAAFNSGWAKTDISDSIFSPQFVIGDVIFNLGTSIFEVDGEMLLGFKPPEQSGAPPRILVKLLDSLGNLVFHIEDNEVRVNSQAFDIQSSGNHWTIHSPESGYIIEVVFELPFRVRLSRLHLKCREWELVTVDEGVGVMKRGKLVAKIGRGVFISGNCLVRCDSSTGKATFSELTFEGLRQTPPPSGSRTLLLPKGKLVFRFPLFFFVSGSRTTPLSQVRLATIIGLGQVFPIFTSKNLATKAGIPDGFRLESLGTGGFRQVLIRIAKPQGITSLCLDPNLETKSQLISTYAIDHVIESHAKINDTEIKAIIKSETEHND